MRQQFEDAFKDTMDKLSFSAEENNRLVKSLSSVQENHMIEADIKLEHDSHRHNIDRVL